ncbi:hypothetical protein WS48_14990 [Burkholderia sp. RF7-non_BP1]|nr:hypothetical protein WS49_03915 [Burkholderia sp. RF7-non_BP4]KUY97396.1 hypothetical protein WS48_14990 [Burkholderia sp. RF7-non_BP1]
MVRVKLIVSIERNAGICTTRERKITSDVVRRMPQAADALAGGARSIESGHAFTFTDGAAAWLRSRLRSGADLEVSPDDLHT